MGRGRGATMAEAPQAGGGAGGGGRAFLEPLDKLGVDGLTGSIARSGGTTTMTGDADQRADGLPGRQRERHVAVPARPPRRRGPEDLARPAEQPGVPRGPAAAREAGHAARHPQPQPEHQHGRQPDVPAARLRRRVADCRAADGSHHQRHHPRRPGGLAQEVLGGEQRDPRRHRRLQEGRDAPEAGGDLRQVAERREGGAALAEARADDEAGRVHGAAAGRDAEPGHHPDRPHRADARRSRLPGRRPDELHAGRRVVLVAHHEDRADRQRPRLHGQLVGPGRDPLPGDVPGVLPDQERDRRVRGPVDARTRSSGCGRATSPTRT